MSTKELSVSRRHELEYEVGEYHLDYAECSCLLLCQQLRDTLPIELREFVYEYILTSQPPLHCWMEEFWPKQCFDEFHNTYYRIDTFALNVGEPVESRLRPNVSLELTDLRDVGPISIEFSFSARIAFFHTLPAKWLTVRDDKCYNDLMASLNELVTLKKGARITINVDDITVWAFHRHDQPDNPNFKTLVNTSDEDIRKFLYNMNAVLFPKFQKLKDAGHRLSFVLNSTLKMSADIALEEEAWFPEVKEHQRVSVVSLNFASTSLMRVCRSYTRLQRRPSVYCIARRTLTANRVDRYTELRWVWGFGNLENMHEHHQGLMEMEM